jgi:hypothetical protein
MSFDVEEFVHYQIANAPLRAYPYPHFYVQPVFPEAFYRRMLETMPDTEALTPMNEFGTVGRVDEKTGERAKSAFEPRYLADLSVLDVEEQANFGNGSDTWRNIADWILGDRFRDLIIGKFMRGIGQRFGGDVRLVTDVEARFVRDMTDYSITPHTDMPTKLVSLLFYLPSDESLQSLGTSVYVPKDPELRCEGESRHRFELFKKVMTAGFLPNSLFGFLKTDQAFHGVEVIKQPAIERNLLLYNIYVKKVVTPAKRASSAPPA